MKETKPHLNIKISTQKIEENNSSFIQIPFQKEVNQVNESENLMISNFIKTNNDMQIDNNINNNLITQSSSPYENQSLKEKFYQLKGKKIT